MYTLFALLVIYQLKHYLADYPLQGKYMLGKFKEKGWVALLSAHALVHAVFTFAIAEIFLLGSDRDLFADHTFSNGVNIGFGWPLILGLYDFVMHFTMDRIKASPNLLGRFKDMYDKKFWWCLGFDQMFHHLTHYSIIAILITR